MRKIALFLAIFISCFGYELGELKNIVKTDGVSGNFTQTKSLAGFNKSIKSSGEFRLEKGEKLSEANTAQAVIEMKSLQTCFEMPEALKKALKAYNEKEKR